MRIRANQRKPVVLRAIHANRGVEQWYRRRLEAMIKRMAESVTLHVRVAYRDADHSHGLAADASPTQLLKRALSKWGRDWQKRFNKMSTALSRKFADKALATTERQFMDALRAGGFTVKFTFTPAMRDAYRATIAEQVGLIKSIPQQYLKDVEGQVWRSVAAGHDMGTLGAELQKTYGISYRRAALIARDQNNKAKAVLENVRRRELGIEEAVWMHSGGGVQPRPSHLKAGQDRQRFSLKTGWYDPDEGKHIWPGMLINCRCTSRAIVPGFED